MLGLTLEGGGAKGAYQVGAWRAFRELNIEFQGITGTSIGALNGALMIQDDYDLAYEIWHELNREAVLKGEVSPYEQWGDKELRRDTLQLLIEEAGRLVKGQGLDISPLRELIHRHVKEDIIRQSPKDFGFVTVNLTDRKPMELFKEAVPQGKLADYLLASAYLPVFQTQKLDGKVFLDGGFYNNLPVDLLYDRGYRKIITVRLMAIGRIKKLSYPDLELIEISPRQSLGRVLDFSRDRARQNLKLGYLDTLRVMKNLKGRTYYIEGKIEEQEALAFFHGLSEDCLKDLAQRMALPPYLPLNRLLVEAFIPKLVTLLDLDKGATYGEILEGLLEAVASHLEVDALTIYTLPELTELVKERARNYPKEMEGEEHTPIFDGLLRRIDRERMLKEVIQVLLCHGQWFLGSEIS